ncbi:MAG TPA: DUF6152 family protein [Caulobacteraceae bacterium]|jgi:hypothetical protein|nr:DUF6152 family protein [Caulobacteraceae bacterium]
MNRRRLVPVSCAVLLATGGAAWAHHSGVMFDRTRTIELKGTVKAFAWTNPHSWIYVVVPNAAGGTEEWGIESGSPSFLVRTDPRWNRKALKAGDAIGVTMHPARDGRRVGVMDQVTFANGDVLKGAGV